MDKLLGFIRGLYLYYTYTPGRVYVNGVRKDFRKKKLRNFGHRIRKWLSYR